MLHLLTEELPQAFKILTPPPDLTVSEWAEQYREFAPNQGGKWHNNKVPYAVAPMDSLTNPMIEEITVLKSSRVGFTQSLVNNSIGYVIDLDPSDIIVLRPTEAACKKWSKSQFDSMVRYTKPLRGKVFNQKTRQKHNEILHKFFNGGELYVVPATSPVGLSDLTAKYLLIDEVDRFVISAGIEGDPVSLAEKRILTVWGAKIVRISSPTIKGISRIEASWKSSNQQHYHVPCPHCQSKQILIFGPRSQFKDLAKGMMKYDGDNLSWWGYECGNCKKLIEENHKTLMITSGEWKPELPEVLTHDGYHISELYSLLSTRGWRGIIKEFLEVKHDSERLQVWINTVAGEVFERHESYHFPVYTLMGRREEYKLLPMGVLFLTAGIDTQDDRFEVVVVGWGMNEESWVIERFIVHGSPGQKSTRDTLDAYLFNRTWEHEGGISMKITAAAFDSQGHHATDIYRYVRDRRDRRFYACKGISGFGRQIVDRDSRDRKIGARLLVIGVDSAKEKIYDRLKNLREEGKPPPDGFMHFPMSCDKEYFEQLTSAVRTKKMVKGNPVEFWDRKPNVRDEVLDCTVLNLVCIQERTLKPIWAEIRQNVEQLIASAKGQSANDAKPTDDRTRPTQPQGPTSRRRRFSLLDRL